MHEIVAAVGGLLVGASLTSMWFRIHATDDTADLAQLRRDYAALYHRMHEREAELFMLLSATHMQAITVDRCVEGR